METVDFNPISIRDAGEQELRGLVEMTNEEYHEAPGTSKSHLDKISELSARHYWAEYVDPDRVRKETPALRLGNAIHRAILEPELFEDRYVTELDLPRRSNADKAAHAQYAKENAGKEILPITEYEHCLRVRDSVHAHPYAAGLLTGGVSEQSYFAIDPETGELIKCRIDYLVGGIDGMIIDLKSCADASPDGFGRSAEQFRYDIQVPWYFDVLAAEFGSHPREFVWIAVEKEWPYAIGIYYADHAMIQRAREIARRDFLRIIHHRRTNHWPDYGYEIQKLKLPSWAKR